MIIYYLKNASVNVNNFGLSYSSDIFNSPAKRGIVSLVKSCRQPLDVFIHPINTLKQSITLTMEQKKIKIHNSRALGDTNGAA